MTAYPDVAVREMASDESYPSDGKPLDLGARTLGKKLIEAGAENLLERTRAICNRRFELTWRGGRIPRGAVVARYVLAWTQNGQVLDNDGQCIGTYERLVENGGPEHDEQCMVVMLYRGHESCTPNRAPA